MSVEECAALTTYETSRGNCDGGSNYFSMVKNTDTSEWGCNCCLADATVADNIEEDTNANIYKAGGDALLFTQTCNIKRKLKGTKLITFGTDQSRELKCGQYNYEFFGVSSFQNVYNAPMNQSFVSLTQVKGSNGDYPDAFTIDTDPTFGANM